MATPVEIERLLVRLVGDTKGYVRSIQAAQDSTEKFVKGADGRFRDLKGRFVSVNRVINNQVEQSIKVLQNYSKELEKLAAKVNKVGKGFVSFGKKMSLYVTTPLVGIGAVAAKSFADYEEKLMQMVALAGVGQHELEGIDKFIKETSRATGVGPAELAESFANIRGSGLEGQAALEALTASAKASATGLGETGTVSDAVTSALNAYGVATLSASRATDILTAAIDAGKLEASSLAPVIGKLLPTASAMEIQFDQIAGTLAVMSRTGLNAAEASTALGSVLNTLNKPTTQAVKLLKDKELSMAKLRDMAKGPAGLINVMRLLDETYRDNDEALAQIIPNINAFRAFMNILSQDASIVDEVMGQVADSVGKADDAFNVAEGTTMRVWRQTMAGIKVELLEIGKIIAPTILDMLSHIRKAVAAFSQLDASTKKTVVAIAAVAATIGPLAIAIGNLILVGGQLLVWASKAIVSVRALTISINLLTLGLKGAALAAALLAAAVIYQLHPATTKHNRELNKQIRLNKQLLDNTKERHAEAMKEAMNSPEARRIELLVKYRKNIEDALRAQKALYNKKEIELEGLTTVLDSHAKDKITTELTHMDQMIGHLEESLAGVNGELDNLSGRNKVTVGVEPVLSNIHPEAIKEFAESLEAQLRNLEIEASGKALGFTPEEIARDQTYHALIEDLAQQGIELSQKEQERLENLNKELKAIEAQTRALKEQDKHYDDLASRTKRVLDDLLTPIEKLRIEYDNLDELLKLGAITKDQAEAAFLKMLEEVEDSMPTKMSKVASGGAAVSATSAEGYSMLNFGQAQKTTEKGVWELVKKTEVQNKTLEQIAQELKEKDETPLGRARIN